MCATEVCSHEIVCAKGSVAPVAAAEEGAAINSLNISRVTCTRTTILTSNVYSCSLVS